jgi:hypothetical protein
MNLVAMYLVAMSHVFLWLQQWTFSLTDRINFCLKRRVLVERHRHTSTNYIADLFWRRTDIMRFVSGS